AIAPGGGNTVANTRPGGLSHAWVPRPPQAPAPFKNRALVAARGMPGARLVLTADDIAELGSLPCTAGVPDQEIAAAAYPILARDEALHVGDCLAFVVVADTLLDAQAAVEAIAVEWEALPCVVDARAAVANGAPPGASDR